MDHTFINETIITSTVEIDSAAENMLVVVEVGCVDYPAASSLDQVVSINGVPVARQHTATGGGTALQMPASFSNIFTPGLITPGLASSAVPITYTTTVAGAPTFKGSIIALGIRVSLIGLLT